MSFINELKKRRVFRVAAMYALVAWGVLQVVDVVGGPLGLPDWFGTVVIVSLGLGFPVALVLGWAFNIEADGITRSSNNDPMPASGRGNLEIALLLVVIIGLGWLVVRDVNSPNGEANYNSSGTPVVVLMDTFAPHGVYDEETRRNSGTNADVLSDLLMGMPIITQKEAIGSTWDREVQVLRQNPDLVVIHRSGFFHSMNQDMGFGTEEGKVALAEEHWDRLYKVADNKLGAFLGFIGTGNQTTKFIVYSRGTGGGWTEADYRANWIKALEGRFPALAGRITAIAVPGGVEKGSFRTKEAETLMRQLVRESLSLEP